MNFFTTYIEIYYPQANCRLTVIYLSAQIDRPSSSARTLSFFMTFTQKIQKAINVSARLHRAHVRIGLDLPYIVHPYSVAVLISEYSKDEDVICAGLLHDVLEDAENYTYDNLADDFGIRVAEIVRGVTEVRTHDENGKILETWYERKQEYLKNLREAGQESLLVCAADTTHNLQSLLVTHVLIGNSVWGSFHASIEEKMNFYENVIDIVSHRLSSGIVTDLNNAYDALSHALNGDEFVQEKKENSPISF